MKNFNLKAENITKSFSRNKIIISNINLYLSNGKIIGVAGPNGSGKTTFLKILCGILKPTKGNVELKIDDSIIKTENYFEHLGYVAPYLNLYDEFTPIEHIKIMSGLTGTTFDNKKAIDLLEMFNLHKKKDDVIRTFSSGMKQRMKYILAIQRDCEILIFDEPMTNLDSAGVESVHEIIKTRTSYGAGVIIATNDERDKLLCHEIVDVSLK
ncbi:MAG: ABC transporter ATP-binding protein [Ignavibacteriae bacterium]|nr:ABC transporter ATP-binding protein [Ignavibacteriota bacterium]